MARGDWRRRTFWAAAAFCGTLVLVSIALAAAGDKVLISRQSAADGGAPSERANSPSISADGQLVAFVSGSPNLSELDDESPGGVFTLDARPRSDVFLRDVTSQETILVSRGPAATGNLAADNGSIESAIAAAGRHVAFTSAAANFSDDDRDTMTSPATQEVSPVLDVFVRDLRTDDTILASRRAGANGAGGGQDSFSPSLSADGHLVAFVSYAENLSPIDQYGADVFVRDLSRRRTILVSRGSGPGAGAANEFSGAAVLSANGRFVAFTSRATNLSRRDREPDVDVYLRDLARERTVLISRGSAHGDATQPAISADGRLVAFVWEQRDRRRETDDSPLNVHVVDVKRGRATLVSVRGGAGPTNEVDGVLPQLSSRGSFVAYVAQERDPFGQDDDLDADIFVRDLRNSRTTLAAGSRADTGVETTNPSLSGDARFLAFEEEPNQFSGATEPRQVFRIQLLD